MGRANIYAVSVDVTSIGGRTNPNNQRNGINVQVLVRDNNVDQALRALKKKMQREGIFREMKLRAMTPSSGIPPSGRCDTFPDPFQGHPEAIDGQWTGRRAVYDAINRAGYSEPHEMTCSNQRCNITTGEGGMVVAKEQDTIQRAFHLKNQGVSQTQEYWHDVVAYNYRMTNICAAIGLAQLENVEEIAATPGLDGLFVDPKTGAPDADTTKKVQAAALARGLLLLTCGVYGNVIRFLFPLTIEDAVFDEGLSALDAALAEVLA